jgi:hypothetical protein
MNRVDGKEEKRNRLVALLFSSFDAAQGIV